MLILSAFSQNAPYDKFPDAEPPYYRLRFEASKKPGELVYPVKYTLWIPPGVKSLRGLIVHQHGCGEGSCKSGLTGAWDLHWQALAKKHGCALISPSYEQPAKADCQMWCDPRNGSGAAFIKSLNDLGKLSGHPELATVPWALWGHSGGGHWAGGMTLLHPEKVAASWLRSGVPMLVGNPDRPSIKFYDKIPDAALEVPIMCNPGTKEGVTDKSGKFARVWPANETFLKKLREKNALIGVSIDPLTAHECGNSRYMAIAWLDSCLTLRLPEQSGAKLKSMPKNDVYLASFLAKNAVPEAEFKGDKDKASWFHSREVAKVWEHFVEDTAIPDNTPPPAPTDLLVKGNQLTWKADADLESGIGHFIIERDGQFLAKVEGPKNRYGRQLFQGLQYSDTPAFPLIQMKFTDNKQESGKTHSYKVISVNTVGLKSK
ncbi:MAG: PHB depolymerase family esterase [Lentisphaeraceae bacterium]|nr:PHB depolymerase family esterase [Lentisphaeraceae bacterium]